MRREHPLRFGANVDPSADGWEGAMAVAQAADGGGLDWITMQDHPYVPRFLDTWTFLTFLAARTDRVHLGTNVANLPLRPPAMLAKAAASLDRLTGGRVELGIGAGASWDGVQSMGGPRREPGEAVEALDEALTLMRRFWESEGRADYDGDHYRLRQARSGPAPAHRIRLWIGAYGPRMLQLTGRQGDGWLPSSTYLPPQEVLGRQQLIDEGARAAGRSTAEIRRGYNLMGRLEVPDLADSTVNLKENVLRGDPAEWVDRLLAFHRELRMDTFIFWPVAGEERRQVEAFAEQVVPAVKDQV